MYIALGLAGLVNMPMLAVSAKLFHTRATLQIAAWSIAVAISLMNVFLIYEQFFMG